jgi:hypothetical protein
MSYYFTFASKLFLIVWTSLNILLILFKLLAPYYAFRE